MEFRDYYEVLGVSRDASKDDIKHAYRRLARKYHPDVSKEDDAENQFKAVGEAYEVLSDPEKRAAYDQLGADWQNGQSFEPPPGWSYNFGNSDSANGDFGNGGFGDSEAFSDFFENLFRQDGFSRSGGSRRAGPRSANSQQGFHANYHGADRHATVDVTLEDLYREEPIEVTLDAVEQSADGRVVRKPRRLKITIPKGIGDGESFRLKGQGHPGSSAEYAGDLYLTLRVRPHAVFSLDGQNIQSELVVAPHEAVLGANKNVQTLGGTVNLKIPADSHSGSKLRLKGRGIGGADQYVTIKIDVPAYVSDEARALYRSLAALEGPEVESKDHETA